MLTNTQNHVTLRADWLVLKILPCLQGKRRTAHLVPPSGKILRCIEGGPRSDSLLNNFKINCGILVKPMVKKSAHFCTNQKKVNIIFLSCEQKETENFVKHGELFHFMERTDSTALI